MGYAQPRLPKTAQSASPRYTDGYTMVFLQKSTPLILYIYVFSVLVLRQINYVDVLG